ncbi:MAG: tetratricopeptide repeat protein [Planctomycetota bacterium]
MAATKKKKKQSGPRVPERLDVATTVSDARELRRDVLMLMGNLLLHRGEGDAALDRFTEAAALAETQKQPGPLARAHVKLGRLYRYRNELDKSQEHYSQAVNHGKKAKNPAATAVAYWEWALLSYFGNDTAETLELLKNAAEQWHAAGSDGDEGKALALIAQIHRADGSFQKSQEAFQDAVELQRGVCDDYELGIALGRLALLNVEQGERDDGLKMLSEAQSMLKKTGAEAEAKLLRTAADKLLSSD